MTASATPLGGTRPECLHVGARIGAPPMAGAARGKSHVLSKDRIVCAQRLGPHLVPRHAVSAALASCKAVFLELPMWAVEEKIIRRVYEPFRTRSCGRRPAIVEAIADEWGQSTGNPYRTGFVGMTQALDQPRGETWQVAPFSGTTAGLGRKAFAVPCAIVPAP